MRVQPAAATRSRRPTSGTSSRRTGTDLPDGEFGGGLPRRTTLSLLLDVSLLAPDQSVKDTANKLLKMMETDGGGGGGGSAPPFVTFRWGSMSLPKSVPVSLTIQYVLFHPNGEPIRATVDIELAQAEKADTASGAGTSQGQNPTTRAISGLRVHRVRDGDSLPSIAYDAYGDPTRWRADRRGQRHRQPAAACAAARSSRSRGSTECPAHSKDHVALYTIMLDGAEHRPQEQRDRIKEIRVVNNLRLPDVCTITSRIPKADGIDTHPFDDRQGSSRSGSAPRRSRRPRRCSRATSSRSSRRSARAASA